jgi:hypothetical protein
MALQGTIKDFGLSDIFQLIGIQRKTGILTLENTEDTVTVHFFEGQVVGADTRLRNLEDLLGGVLVRTGRITEEQLQEALRVQKKTLQRLGYLLVQSGFINENDLKEALRVQVTQIVYRLFRWREGSYRFTPVEHLEYDREHFVPVSAETILMEGARMIDEWPIIERKIRSAQMVFQKTPSAAALEGPVQSLVDADIDFRLAGNEDRGEEPSSEGELRISPDDREILRLVDGELGVQDIVDRSPLGEFDVYRILYELLNRHLIEEVPSAKAPGTVRQADGPSRVLGRAVQVLLLVIAALAVATFERNPLNPWRMAFQGEQQNQLAVYAGRGRVERIDRALRVFYLDLGDLPDRLARLASNGYLEEHDLLDPWGRPYEYRRIPGGYVILGLDSEGNPSPELSLTHRFSSAQRLVLEGTSSETPPDPAPEP